MRAGRGAHRGGRGRAQAHRQNGWYVILVYLTAALVISTLDSPFMIY
jgi:hypothetical protein